ncbi:hypothetical protein NODU109028_00450 [Nocardioides dubius]|uniref:Uncharacterized protein n=1 Tax=Nocardioides dubius TaxID=317019 RepID=A0ABN1U0A1_9ACTN
MSAPAYRMAVAVLLASTALAACSDDEPELAEEWSVRAALEQVPASTAQDGLFVVTADLDAAIAAADVERSGEPDELDWLIAITGGAQGGSVGRVFVPMARGFNVEYLRDGEFAAAAGWSVHDVDSFVESGQPPRVLTVAAGDFDDDTLADGLVEVEDDIVSNRDAEDGTTDLSQANGLSPIGVPIRMSEADGLIALSTSTELVRSWRDGADALAGEERAAAVADALDDEDVYAAVLSDPLAVDALGARTTSPALIERLLARVPEQAYDAVGIGWSLDDGAVQVQVAYHFADERDAAGGAAALEALWREGVSVRDGRPFAERLEVVEVETDDSVVTVELLPTAEGRPQLAFEMLQNGEPLFVSR